MSVCADQASYVPDKSGVDPRREGISRRIKRKNGMSASKQKGTSCIKQNTLKVLTRDANRIRLYTWRAIWTIVFTLWPWYLIKQFWLLQFSLYTVAVSIGLDCFLKTFRLLELQTGNVQLPCVRAQSRRTQNRWVPELRQQRRPDIWVTYTFSPT